MTQNIARRRRLFRYWFAGSATPAPLVHFQKRSMWQPFGELIDHAMNRAGTRRTVSAAIVVDAAQQLLAQMVPHIRPADFRVVSFTAGTLTVAVGSPAVGSELLVRSAALLEALRQELPTGNIVRLRVRPKRVGEQEPRFR